MKTSHEGRLEKQMQHIKRVIKRNLEVGGCREIEISPRQKATNGVLPLIFVLSFIAVFILNGLYISKCTEEYLPGNKLCPLFKHSRKNI